MRYITDAGHGWLEVSLSEYPDAADFGTGFGYLDAAKGLIYLEEDCEAGAFMRAHPEAREGITLVQVDGDSAVRQLPRNESRMTGEEAYA